MTMKVSSRNNRRASTSHTAKAFDMYVHGVYALGK